MQIFEYPYIIITIFVLCFIVLGAVGVSFAIRGLKTARGQAENDFSTIRKMESAFQKLGRLRADRCVVYVGISSDNLRDLHAEQSLLAEMKQILLHTFSNGGDSAISAYGENNFVALTPWDEETATQNAEGCLRELDSCLLRHEALKTVHVRMGLHFATGSHVTFDEAIGRAKQACTLAKNENLPFALWSATSGKALEKKIKIQNNIEKQIDNNRFFLEYQPVLDAATKKIVGAEVLSRLNSEGDGVLSPGTFLSAVDDLGLSDKFDYYIFEKNCKWISNNKSQRQRYKYTINFSRSTLCEPAFAEKIIGIAQKYDLNLSCLAVEILEDKNVTGTARNQMIENLSTLKEKGISILLDDFGSGYTTFGDLQNLDISVVKIDKAITRNALTETGFIILKNIIQTSKDIGFKTLCEGVETKELEEVAIRAGCDFLQGYYYYKPMPVAALEKLLDTSSEGL